MKLDVRHVLKTSLLYCALAAAFSLVAVLIPEKHIQENPITHGSLNLKEISGHIAWGLVAGAASLSLRYFIISGLFAVLIDSDHLIALSHIEGMERMAHSIPFGILAALVMMLLFGKKNYLLGAIAFAAVFAHISYDLFLKDDLGFPLFAPFFNRLIPFHPADWIYFEIAAIAIIGVTAFITKKRSKVEKIIRG